MRRFTVVLRGGIVLQVDAPSGDGENIADFYDLKGFQQLPNI